MLRLELVAGPVLKLVLDDVNEITNWTINQIIVNC